MSDEILAEAREEEEIEEIEEEIKGEGEEEHEEDGKVEIVVGEDSEDEEDGEPKEEIELIRHLRARIKEQNKEGKATSKEVQKLRKQLEELSSKSKGEEEELILPPKPTSESCNYDNEEFERKLDAWHEQKRKVDEQKAKKEAAQKSEEENWNKKLAVYNEQKSTLKVDDVEDAEEVAKELLSITQQGIIVQAAKDPAKLIYAIGRYPDKFAELIETKDPIEFAMMAGRLESEVKMRTKRPATSPEKPLKGGGGAITNNNKKLEQLREEARKSGNYNAYYEFKRKLEEAEKKE